MIRRSAHRLPRPVYEVLRLVFILILAFGINSLILIAIGKNPLDVYGELFYGSLAGTYSLAKTLRWMTLLLLCGTSAAIAFNGGVLNLGIDGQLYMGAMAATVWLQYTASGFETRIVDKNPLFASTMGISVGKKTLVLMLASGVVAGLAGALEIIGVQHRFVSSFISGVGFDGMVVSMLAGNNMLLLSVAAFFMGIMESGSASLEMFAGIPRAMAEVLMGIIILFVTVDLKRPKELLRKMLGHICSPGLKSARRSR